MSFFTCHCFDEMLKAFKKVDLDDELVVNGDIENQLNIVTPLPQQEDLIKEKIESEFIIVDKIKIK